MNGEILKNTSNLLKLTDIIINYSKSGKSDTEILNMFSGVDDKDILDTVNSALILSKII